jgi:hypothetical protein
VAGCYEYGDEPTVSGSTELFIDCIALPFLLRKYALCVLLMGLSFI